MRSTIICVDDEKMILNILSDQLESWFGTNYCIEKALGGEEALEILNDCISEDIDVSCVISDYIMPVMKGDELLEKVRNIDTRIKKIMLTGYSSIEGIISAINRAGLYRYITKPWDSRDLMLTLVEAIKSYEQEKEAARISKGFERLYKEYEKLYLDSERKFNGSIESFVKALELKDPNSEGSSDRVAKYTEILAKRAGINETEIKTLKISAMLYNIGKLIMNDDNQKNSELSIKQQIINSESIISQMADSEKLLKGIKYQFEKFGGGGIFDLKGSNIPLEARIIATAAYYDKLKSKKANLSTDEIFSELNKTKETTLDPKLVDTLKDLIVAEKI